MKREMHRAYPIWLRTLARAATLLYAAAVVVLSLIPGKDVPMSDISDKYRHAAAYSVFAILMCVSFLRPRWRPTLAAFAIVSCVGLVLEFIQPSFHRSYDLEDALANAIGAAIGCGTLLALRLLSVRMGMASSPRTLEVMADS